MYGEGYSNGLAQTKHETPYVPRKTYGSKNVSRKYCGPSIERHFFVGRRPVMLNPRKRRSILPTRKRGEKKKKPNILKFDQASGGLPRPENI